jgi:hypothetical protein
MKTISCLALAALIASSSCGAAPLNPSLIPADARWVVYADLNALRSSALGKELIAMAEKAQFQKAVIGLDFQKTLATVGTLTAYGSNFSPDPKALDGTLVLQGTPDLRKIAESVLLQATIASPESVSESKELPFPSYTVHPKQKADAPAQSVIIAFPPEPIVLVSKSSAQLLKARDAFRGNVPSVAKVGDAPLKPLMHMSEHAYLFAASIVPLDAAFPENQPQARILKITNSGSLSLGEEGPNTFAHATLIATSDDMAEKLMKILQGMTAALSLTETNDKQLAEFLNSATVTRDERRVSLRLSYASDRLAQMLRAIEPKPQAAHEEENEDEADNRRAQQLLNGDPVAQWQAKAAGEADKEKAGAITWRTIENVTLKNGARVSLGRDSNGGNAVRYDRVEITASAGGPPMIFRADSMRPGPRGNIRFFVFPGVDGTYTLRVGYVNDAQGKARYAISVRQPKSSEAAAEPPASPSTPLPPADKS